MPSIQAIVADAHPLVLRGLCSLLHDSGEVEVTGCASDADTLRRACAAHPARVLLLAADLPGAASPELVRELRERHPHLVALLLCSPSAPAPVRGALDCGAAAHLAMDDSPEYLMQAVRGAAGGEVGWISRRLVAGMMSSAGQGTPALASLTARERQVLTLIAQGHANGTVARSLFISADTVKNHVSNIFSKLNVRTRSEAAAWAWKTGLACAA
jgi:DNA-binding NarL/FixJ family response regulator